MNRKNWTQEELEFLQDNYNKLSLEDLSRIMGWSESSIKHKAERNDIKSSRWWTEDEINYLKEHYKDQTYNQLAKHLGRTKTAVDLKINKLGLVKSKYEYDHSFFKEIDTEEKAYWCGFIMADGCVCINEEINSCEVGIKLQAGDGEHLKKFNKSLHGNVPVTYFDDWETLPQKTEPTLSKQAQIRLYSEEMFHDLGQYGVIPHKSLIKEFPDNIPEDLMSHYIRGYYDGNGYISSSRNKYIHCGFSTGSLKFAQGLVAYLEKKDIRLSVYPSKTSHCFKISIKGMANVNNFLNYIYSDSTIYLDRKFQKKNKLYSVTNMEQRLLRQTEKSVHSR